MNAGFLSALFNSKRIINQIQGIPLSYENGKYTGKKIILLIGPESSGTRIFTEVLSGHPLILGTLNATEHHDVLDAVWRALKSGDLDLAKYLLPDLKDATCLLTRRSMPHGEYIGHTPQPMDFPNVESFHQLCQLIELPLVVLITTRSTAANLASWALARSTSRSSIQLAMMQYREAYLHLFRFLTKSRVPFFFVSLEALILDSQKYLQSIFQMLGLPMHHMKLELKLEVNKKRYEWFEKQGKKGCLI